PEENEVECVQLLWILSVLHPQTPSQSWVIGSPQPIVALAGDDVILPCHLEPAISDFSDTVEWTREDLDPPYLHVHQSGRLLVQLQNPLYKYRTILFVDELKNGNVSLKLFTVTISDEGRYLCFIPSMRRGDFIQLNVGVASSPVLNVSKSSSGVVLECESKGWYPEPELFWLDAEGKLLSAGAPETVRGPDGLYTVSSRVTVEKSHSNSFTCRVQQLSINQSRDTHIHVPGEEGLILLKSMLLCVLSLQVISSWTHLQKSELERELKEIEQRWFPSKEKIAHMHQELKHIKTLTDKIHCKL
uniref:Ig-like domain-containing protein n=1 Tax=Myripristis murdjan TaxID=586833 RepID=A0A667ZMV6_9TELE